MVEQQSVCLRRLGRDRSGEVRFGRLLRNERVTVGKLIEGGCAGVGPRTAGAHVLLIEDTSELKYQAHARRVRALGTVDNGTDAGLFVHPVLAVEADQGVCLGLVHLHLWRRAQPKAANYRQLPIEFKESLRWIEAAQRSRAQVPQARQGTVMADREADIYEMWARLPDERTHLLIRACRDCKVADDSLFEWLSGLPERGRHAVELPAVAGKRSAYRAVLQVRFARTRIVRLRYCSAGTLHAGWS